MRPTHKMLDKNYKSLGVCIMCLDDAFPRRELTEEHIIPAAIGGTLRFKGGVCRQCAEAQNAAFEQPTLQNDLLIPRLLIKLRNKAPSVPFPKVAVLSSGQSIEDVEFDKVVSLDLYPKLLSFTYFPAPGKLRGVNEPPGITRLSVLIINIGQWYANSTDYYENGLVTRHPFLAGALPLSVVKMAYCFAVAERGLHYFDGAEVRDLLQGRRYDFMNFFGGVETELKGKSGMVKKGLPLHHISLSIYPGRVLVGRVNLFGSYGGPTYLVVLGKIL